MKKIILLFCLFGSLPLISQNIEGVTKDAFAHTFSIVARDTITGEMAVGVQSHWFSVGSIVSWGKAGVGVVATQSFVNPAYGPEGLELMANGVPAEQALTELVEKDNGRDFRQVAFLDANGNVSAFTGEKCVEAAEDLQGRNFSVQANMMLNDKVVPAMAEAFVRYADYPLAERVVEALKAAQEAGGDIRGKQSAALVVVGPERTENAWEEKKIDLRVDDHENPIQELSRLLKVNRAYDHMNKGDLAVEAGNMEKALEEYGTAEKMFPENLEMKFWKAVALANSGRINEAKPIFQEVFKADKNWKEMITRLPASGILTISEAELKEITE
ncbi:DUF1028 domain-containing protein [Christiangramia forsetii]|uniref:Secreted protein containing DUF1028 n=2 Tax=Christiangramia forsetii TaxID=411153 RepID=A0M6Z6_CHRFK|nr:DUF1028 domain-containing protein [Christiangramia forsetii]GGG29098.1 hypothetical protein GCM10011532_10720 [Christiangramia forsetii]CAL68391.1 secreted protein containing DUF1028 [Christiangramia forsetii KT0803]